MSSAVDEQAILDALHRVPPERWGEVLTFLQTLRPAPEPASKSGDKRPMTAADLLNSGLVGLWADRSDLDDSRTFARRLREQAQRRDHRP